MCDRKASRFSILLARLRLYVDNCYRVVRELPLLGRAVVRSVPETERVPVRCYRCYICVSTVLVSRARTASQCPEPAVVLRYIQCHHTLSHARRNRSHHLARLDRPNRDGRIHGPRLSLGGVGSTEYAQTIRRTSHTKPAVIARPLGTREDGIPATRAGDDRFQKQNLESGPVQAADEQGEDRDDLEPANPHQECHEQFGRIGELEIASERAE